MMIFIFWGVTAQAKPVTWEGGWQIMSMNDPDINALHVMYTVTPTLSIQNRADYMREDKIFLGGLQLNYLLERWNFPNAQGNIYVSGGVGMADDNHHNDQSAAAFANMLADYETRRFFISYEADGLAAGNVTNQLWHRGRIGLAPYEGDYHDVHTWIMLQTDLRANMDDEVSVTPMVRMFKTNWMLEAGVNTDGKGMFNAIIQF